jgi:hypothetical protein
VSNSVISLEKFRNDKKNKKVISKSDEVDIYISELKDEFNELLNGEKGGEKNGSTRKTNRKRT